MRHASRLRCGLRPGLPRVERCISGSGFGFGSAAPKGTLKGSGLRWWRGGAIPGVACLPRRAWPRACGLRLAPKPSHFPYTAGWHARDVPGAGRARGGACRRRGVPTACRAGLPSVRDENSSTIAPPSTVAPRARPYGGLGGPRAPRAPRRPVKKSKEATRARPSRPTGPSPPCRHACRHGIDWRWRWPSIAYSPRGGRLRTSPHGRTAALRGALPAVRGLADAASAGGRRRSSSRAAIRAHLPAGPHAA